MEALEAIVASEPEDRQTWPTCLLVIMSTQDATLAAPLKPGQSSFYWNKIMFNLTSLSCAAARDWNLQFHLIRLIENITIETRQNHIIH